MAGTKVNTYEITGNDDVDAIEETVDKTNKGKCAVSLTEMDTTVQPQIAAGSVVEVNGSLFEFEADESISGTPSDGTVYIKLIPAGSPATLTAQFTNTAPVWDKEKQGWYSPTAGEENYRYLEFGMTKAGSLYSNKFQFSYKWDSNIVVKKYANGNVALNKILGGVGKLNDTTELTGTTTSGNAITDINYPPGFTIDNTYLIGFKIYDTSNAGYIIAEASLLYIILRSDKIRIWCQYAQNQGQPYKLLIGRF